MVLGVLGSDYRPATPASLTFYVLRVRVKQHGYRAVVEEFHFHVGSEAACFDLEALGAEQLGAPVNESFGHFGPSGVCEGGPPAFAGVGIEGELGDEQPRPAGVGQGQVELA